MKHDANVSSNAAAEQVQFFFIMHFVIIIHVRYIYNFIYIYIYIKIIIFFLIIIKCFICHIHNYTEYN